MTLRIMILIISVVALVISIKAYKNSKKRYECIWLEIVVKNKLIKNDKIRIGNILGIWMPEV